MEVKHVDYALRALVASASRRGSVAGMLGGLLAVSRLRDTSAAKKRGKRGKVIIGPEVNGSGCRAILMATNAAVAGATVRTIAICRPWQRARCGIVPRSRV